MRTRWSPGIDSDSHRLRTEVSIALANLDLADLDLTAVVCGANRRMALSICAAGGDEAIEEAMSDASALAGMPFPSVVRSLWKSAHHAQCTRACEVFLEHIERAAMIARQSDAGRAHRSRLLRVAADALHRHTVSPAVTSPAHSNTASFSGTSAGLLTHTSSLTQASTVVASALLRLLGSLTRWQPSYCALAARLRRDHARHRCPGRALATR